MRLTKQDILDKIKGQLIVSCQALPSEPLYVGKIHYVPYGKELPNRPAPPCIPYQQHPRRACDQEETGLPVIGIIKINYDGC